MSLASFLLDNKDVRDRFRQEFRKPRFAVKKELLAPPLTNRFGLVGTAFDYLMRFYLERLNPDAITVEWVAEHSINNPLSPLLKDVVLDAETDEVLSFTETELTRKSRSIIERAKKDYRAYLSSGELVDDLLESTLRLAQLDPIYRAGIIDENLGIVHEEDVADLRNLITIVDPDLFNVQDLCLLNPTFGQGSSLVDGADADLYLDGVIIDIKTTKKLELQRRHFDQLVGYYVLHEIDGVGELRPKPEVTSLGIYYSRYAHLHTIELHEVIDRQTFPDFLKWFQKRASEEFGVSPL